MSDELREWYEETTYREINSIIRDRMSVMAREYVGIGFYLRRVRDNAMYLEDGYTDIHEYAMAEFGMSKSTVNHCMRINEQFSVNGNAPMIDTRYKEFSKSQPQEMLYLPEDKREDVTPDMTVKQIRDMKDNRLDVEPDDEQIPGQMNVYDFPEFLPKEPVSILGYSLRVYPEGSIAATAGCGKQDCFSCHRDGCNLRQEYCYCVEAPMGNPFPCLTLNVVESLRNDMGNSCQFVNEDLAYHRAGDGQPVPCCKKCANPCGYECSRSVHSRKVVLDKAMESNDALSDQTLDTSDWPEVEDEPVEIEAECMDALQESQQNESECCENAAEDTIDWNPLFIRDCLETEERNLKDYHAVEGIPFEALIRQEALVVGLRKILSDAESVTSETDDDEAEEDVYIQPELPVLKNNDQRKEWLRNYKDWGLWYEDEHIGCKYYKYEFENGAILVAEEYRMGKTEYCSEYDRSYLHLFGGQPCKYDKYGQIKYQMHEKYDRFPNNETELCEFLKEIQRK